MLLMLCCAAVYAHAQKDSLLIGPGDKLQIQVLEAPELTQQTRVTDEGFVPLILGGRVEVVGLTPAQAASAVAQVLVDNNFLLHPHVNVLVDQYATQSVSVLGQVHTPGSFPVATPRSILDVLALAGGITEYADRNITIQRRNSKQRVGYFLSNDSSAAMESSVSVFPGDTVIVPKASIVYVLGDVGRPGGYVMTTNDGKLSVLQVISLAGATRPTAVPSHARLIRKQPDGTYVESQLPLSAMQKGKASDLMLKPDDIVYVPFSYIRNMAIGATSLVSAAGSAAIYRF
jgi:polysaccharide export outer membrane protein